MMLGFIHIHRLGSESIPSLWGLGIPSWGTIGGSITESLYMARFCSVKGHCSVVHGRKNSFPMSRSSSPGTWLWKLYQNSGFFSFRSIFSRKIGRGRLPKGHRSLRHFLKPLLGHWIWCSISHLENSSGGTLEVLERGAPMSHWLVVRLEETCDLEHSSKQRNTKKSL